MPDPSVPPLTLVLLPAEYAVCRYAQVPPLPHSTGLVSLTRTDDETSLVCPVGDVPTGATLVEPGWAAMRVAGQLDFALVGILAKLAGTLADAGVSIFAISTYDTDYLLVRTAQLELAVGSLRQAGCRVM